MGEEFRQTLTLWDFTRPFLLTDSFVILTV
jgi:hypothetical protein